LKRDLLTLRRGASQGQDEDHQGQDMSQGNREREASQGQEEADTDISRNTESITEIDREARMTGEEGLQDIVKRSLRNHLGDRLRKREEL
jgi:hypothetical protein